MSLIALGVAAVLGAAPCEDVPAALLPLQAARTEAEARQAITALGMRLHTPLELGGEPWQQLVSLAQERLPAACALSRGAQPPAPAPAKLAEILAREEFANARGGRLAALSRLIERWLSRLFGTRGVGVFNEAVRVAVLALAFALVIAGALRVWLWRRRGVRSMEAASEVPLPSGLRPSTEHLAAARSALETEPREALRQGLLALLSALERRSWARPDRVRTNRELALELPRRGAPEEVTRQVNGLMREYDAAFYSLDPVEPQRASRFVSDVEVLQRALTERPA